MRRTALAALLAAAALPAALAADAAVSAGGDATRDCSAGDAHLASEAALLACLDGDAFSDADEGRRVLEASLLRGWYDAASRAIDVAHAGGHDLSTTLHQVSGRIRSRLSELSEQLTKTKHSEGIPPAFEWAQSVDSVFVNVKWAHKLDTPATLGCEAHEPAFAARRLVFRATCREKRKAFTLALDLNGDIVPENCTWANAAVGRASLTLRKATEKPWPRLLNGTKKPGNMHSWWSMQEKYADELEAWGKRTPTPSPTAAAAVNATASPAVAAGADAAPMASVSESPGPAPTADPAEPVAAQGGADAGSS